MISWSAFYCPQIHLRSFSLWACFETTQIWRNWCFLWSLCCEARLKALLISCLCLVPASLSLCLRPFYLNYHPCPAPSQSSVWRLLIYISLSRAATRARGQTLAVSLTKRRATRQTRCAAVTTWPTSLSWWVLTARWVNLLRTYWWLYWQELKCDSWCDRIYWQKLAGQEMLMWEDKLLFVPRAEFPWRHRPQHHHLHRLRALCPRLSRHTHRLPKTLEVSDWLGC